MSLKPEISDLSTDFKLVSRNDSLQQWERAVTELHSHSSKGFLSCGNINEVQNDRLIGSEHITIGDSEEQGVADLPGSSGDGHAHGLLGSSLHKLMALTKRFLREYLNI
mgnify:FL=1